MPSQVSMAIYNSNMETIAKREGASNSINSGAAIHTAMQSNQVSQAMLGGRSVPSGARGDLNGTGSKNAVVFSQHQGRNSLGKFRQNKNEKQQELAIA